MQTLLPYPDFEQSAKVLDDQRLCKQRVEAYQILLALLGEQRGWDAHPAVCMWRGAERGLVTYALRMCQEWEKRGHQDRLARKIVELYPRVQTALKRPAWLGREEIHASHRSNLLRKNEAHYRQFGWAEPNDLKYVWPTKERKEHGSIAGG